MLRAIGSKKPHLEAAPAAERPSAEGRCTRFCEDAEVPDSYAPQPLNEAVRRRLSAHPRKDSVPERRLRSALHGAGLRFFVERTPLPAMGRRRADVVFPRAKVAVYMHGCFWHGCPEHGTWPRNNDEWWRTKINKTQERDVETKRVLVEAGWYVFEVWEHEDAGQAANRIARVVRARRSTMAHALGRPLPSTESAEACRI